MIKSLIYIGSSIDHQFSGYITLAFIRGHAVAKRNAFRYLGVVCCLCTQPVTIGLTEEATPSQIYVGRDGALARDNIANPLGGDANLLGKAILT